MYKRYHDVKAMLLGMEAAGGGSSRSLPTGAATTSASSSDGGSSGAGGASDSTSDSKCVAAGGVGCACGLAACAQSGVAHSRLGGFVLRGMTA
jgi:hypothetical protein